MAKHPMPWSKALLLSLTLAFAAARPVSAHDMWIQPSSFAVNAGELVRVALRLGAPGPEAEVVPRSPSRIERFDAVVAGTTNPVLGPDGHDPAGLLRPTTPGLHVLVLETTRAAIELDAARFDHYLGEEGLEGIRAQRAARGETDLPGREIYTRHLKALVRVGRAPVANDRPLGLELELVCETPSAEQQAGRPLTFRLLFRGQPVAGALLDARRLDGTGSRLAGRTDAEGRWTSTPGEPAAWVITATHMIAAPAETGAQWQSFWASLSFDLPASP